MSNDQPIPSGSSRSDALRGALRDVAPAQRLAVRTIAGEELRGIFRSLEGETLVLSPMPYDERTTRIPFDTIAAVDRVGHYGGPGVAIGIALAALPFMRLAEIAGAWSKELGGFSLLLVFAGLLGVGMAGSIGAVFGGAISRREPLAVTKPTTP